MADRSFGRSLPSHKSQYFLNISVYVRVCLYVCMLYVVCCMLYVVCLYVCMFVCSYVFVCVCVSCHRIYSLVSVFVFLVFAIFCIVKHVLTGFRVFELVLHLLT